MASSIVTGVLEGLQTKVATLEKENQDLRDRVEKLEAKADAAEQYSRRNCLRIAGVPEDQAAIYLTFIRPLLEYGDVLWDNCTQYEKDELDKIQNEAARIATGATKLISLFALSNEIKWKVLTRDAENIN